MSPLSDHFTHWQLGEHDSGWEAAFRQFDNVAVADEPYLQVPVLFASSFIC